MQKPTFFHASIGISGIYYSFFAYSEELTQGFLIEVQVPIGNFEGDPLLFTSDIFFMRKLRDQKQVRYALLTDAYMYTLCKSETQAC